ASKTSWAWLVLPPLHVLAVALPVWLTLWAGKRRIVSGSPQRAWGAFASGLILAPAIIMVLEIIVMVVVGVSIVVFIPETIHEMERIAQLAEIGRLDETKLLEIIGGILQKPAAVIIMLGFFAGAVPLIEELFKPVGVWLLAGRRLSPAEGMVMGMISGAGYAFFETLIGISTPDGWGVAILTRIGTGVIHILTTGLTGWALAMAWSQKRYLRLVAAYFTSVVIHGLWNASAVLSALAAVSSMGNADGVIAPHWIVSGWIVLLVLTIAGTILLFKFNAVFRQQNDEPAAAELEPAA
ncbi:MAG: PrsW family intramembrane metalloprotease, partial [Anaerolineae bacterium]|nr:PrsW family intramembrane metalloprotease [Anaerolineae bacterium]